MNFYQVAPTHAATERQLETTTCAGPFLVAAKTAYWAREIVSMNYTIAIKRIPGEATPISIWSDETASELTRIEEPAIQQMEPRRTFFNGIDVAAYSIDVPEYIVGNELRARMLWWPCGYGDYFPLNIDNDDRAKFGGSSAARIS